MPGDFYEVMAAQDAAAGKRVAQEQNAARLALYRHTHVSTGVGPVRLQTPIDFDVIFIEQPHFTTGSSVIEGADPNLWYPQLGTAGVWQWLRNPKGHYTGAFIHLEVRMETIDGAYAEYPPVKTAHDLLFSGVAYKDLGSAVATEAQIMTPRSVNFGGS